jgi:hypothetical protein
VTTPNTLPLFFRVRQQFESHRLDDIPLAVQGALARASLAEKIQPGQRVAISVGSRGINNLSTIVAAVVREIQAIGAEPLIVPAMGSHGGATAEGQTKVLATYGVTESAMGCPVVASMETVLVGTTDDGVDVHFDRVASQADHVVVVNRVKPHTRLAGKFESGLIKMLMIGLGKHRGASLYHQVFPDFDYSLNRLAPSIVEMIVDRMPVTLGLAIVEDAFENTSHIEAVEATEFLNREPELLELAKSRMPRLPFDRAELLIVDQIGKEISGTGMDTNVIGRKANDKSAAPDEFPKIRQIYIRSLTDKTAGNACGIGVAEYCHRRVVEAMNEEITKINCVTSAHPSAGAIPLTYDSDREVLEAAIGQISSDRAEDVKWMWIRDTLNVDEVACSKGFFDAAKKRSDLEILEDPSPLRFDQAGNLLPS